MEHCKVFGLQSPGDIIMLSLGKTKFGSLANKLSCTMYRLATVQQNVNSRIKFSTSIKLMIHQTLVMSDFWYTKSNIQSI